VHDRGWIFFRYYAGPFSFEAGCPQVPRGLAIYVGPMFLEYPAENAVWRR
jgi:hypothetical protein